MKRPSEQEISNNVKTALSEDVGSGDVSAQLVPGQEIGSARVICREAAVLCGTDWFDETFRQVEPEVSIDWRLADGDPVEARAEICTLCGPARGLLTGERAALNFLQALSATATVTRRYVQAVAHTKARILDTRKTLPGLRLAQKYAVACGGGNNHRFGLYDAFLIKENHIAAAGSLAAAVEAARHQGAELLVEVEVETLGQLEDAIKARAQRVMLDNFDLELMRQAVALNEGRVELEASGGVDLQTIAEIAETGVDYISVGALTKNIQAIDLSMRFF
jgi:nicotinate-nucleotide pyrophosphorylase (carboxylating)